MPGFNFPKSRDPTGLSAAAEATRLENQATLYRMQAKSAKTAGYLKAGSTLLSGARDARVAWLDANAKKGD